jgi:hypothetical protein
LDHSRRHPLPEGAVTAPSQQAPIVQPGAPGHSNKILTPEAAVAPSRGPTDADTYFMQGMIPMNWGADAIFNLSNGKLTLASYYKMPAAQTEFENCVAHNGSLVPIPGRDVLVQAWYQGGVSMVDFTDAAHPAEIAYFDRGPVDGAKRAMGGQWSVYWYNGYIYGSEIARGVDVFRIVPNKYITQNEIDAANQVHFDELNVQNQPKIVWPANFVVARAYLDQLTRSSALPAERLAALKAEIDKADASPTDKKEAAQLQSMAAALEKDAASSKAPADAERIHALAAIFNQNASSRR